MNPDLIKAYPLKTPWKINYELAESPYEQVKNRVNSEDNLTWCRNWEIIKDIKKVKKHG